MTRIKKQFFILIASVCLCMCVIFGCAACSEDGTGNATNTMETKQQLTFDDEEIALQLYESRILTYTYNGTETVEWESSAQDIVSVENGVIIAHKVGNAVITLKTSKLQDTCAVHVQEIQANKVSFYITLGKNDLTVGDTAHITSILTYNNHKVEEYSVIYESSNAEIVSVKENGDVSILKFGEADITAKVVYNDQPFYAGLHIVVSTGYTATAESVEVYAVDTYDGKAYENTAYATVKVFQKGEEISSNYELLWRAKSNDVFDIAQDGKVTGKKVGSGYIEYDVKIADQIVCSGKVAVYVNTLLVNLENGQSEYEANKEYTLNFSALSGLKINSVQVYHGETYLTIPCTENSKAVFPDILSGFDRKLVIKTDTITFATDIDIFIPIYTVADMDVLKTATTGYYKLMNDIDMANCDWTTNSTFSGMLDGQNYAIKNLTINDKIGLFATIKAPAKIKNLQLKHVVVANDVQGAAIAYKCVSSNDKKVCFENMLVEVSLGNGEYNGGLLGIVNSGKVDLTDCKITAYQPLGKSVDCGAITGSNSATFTFTNTSVYTNINLCSSTLDYADLNKTENLTIPLTRLDSMNVGSLRFTEIDLDESISSWISYSGINKQEGTGNAYLAEYDKVVDMDANQEILVVAEKTDNSIVGYIIPTTYRKEIGQSNIRELMHITDGEVYLVEDVDMSAIDDWDASLGGEERYFTGVFDGQGHSISNFKPMDVSNVGLFCRLKDEATIKNLAMLNVQLSQTKQQGVLAGQINSSTVKIENIFVTTSFGKSITVQGGLVANYEIPELITFKDVFVYVKSMPNQYVAKNGFAIGRIGTQSQIKINNGFIIPASTYDGKTLFPVAGPYPYKPSYAQTTEQVNTLFLSEKGTDYYQSNSKFDENTVAKMTPMIKEYYDQLPAIPLLNVTSISTVEELKAITHGPSRDNKTAYVGNNQIYALTNDIDLSNETGWNPQEYGRTYFMGTLDGQGYAIKGLNLDKESNNISGLFDSFHGNATIKNLALLDVTLDKNFQTAPLAGGVLKDANVTIENVFVTVNAITFVYYQSGLITQAENTATITCKDVFIQVEEINIAPAKGCYAGVPRNGFMVGRLATVTTLNVSNAFFVAPTVTALEDQTYNKLSVTKDQVISLKIVGLATDSKYLGTAEAIEALATEGTHYYQSSSLNFDETTTAKMTDMIKKYYTDILSQNNN